MSSPPVPSMPAEGPAATATLCTVAITPTEEKTTANEKRQLLHTHTHTLECRLPPFCKLPSWTGLSRLPFEGSSVAVSHWLWAAAQAVGASCGIVVESAVEIDLEKREGSWEGAK